MPWNASTLTVRTRIGLSWAEASESSEAAATMALQSIVQLTFSSFLVSVGEEEERAGSAAGSSTIKKNEKQRKRK